MSHFLSNVRQTMLACRRSRPIPEDFLQALHLNSLSLTALLPHLDPPVPSSASQRLLDFESSSSNDDVESRAFAASSAQILFLNQNQEQRSGYIPSHFPALPGKHSYRETIELPTRERDPKRIREQAIEEGRLGEEALRRLLSARMGRKAELSRQQDKDLRDMGDTARLRVKRQRLLEEVMQIKRWDETGKEEDEADQSDAMEIDLGEGGKQTDSGDLAAMRQISSGVNYEKKYWRKVAPQRAGGEDGGGG